MEFQELADNPQESVILLTILGLLLSQDLNAANAGILGRIIIYFGEVVTTVAVLLAAKEAEKNAQAKAEEISEDTIPVGNKNYAAYINIANIEGLISELQQQNLYLQEQIEDLRKELSSIQNKY